MKNAVGSEISITPLLEATGAALQKPSITGVANVK
jgi:hypothetical protein